MGYYIDFVFDDQVSNYEEVVDLFCKSGATVQDYSGEELPDDLIIKMHDFIELKHPEFDYFISVNKKEARNLKGNWAYIRLSWGEPV